MAIRFYCQNCHQLLSIGSRKAGTEIRCPKCSIPQRVPHESVPLQLPPGASSLSEEASVAAILKDLGMMCVHDEQSLDDSPREIGKAATGAPFADQAPPLSLDIDLLLDTSPESTIEAPPVQRTRQPESLVSVAALPSAAAKRQRLDWDSPSITEISAPPRAYAQSGLSRSQWVLVAGAFVGIAIGMFFLGYLLGRRVERHNQSENATPARGAAGESVLLNGTVIFDNGLGQNSADSGAIVFALPEGKFPKEAIVTEGLRPGDPAPGEKTPGAEAIKTLGGAVARVDANGSFRMTLPARGAYRILIISNHVNRPPAVEISDGDLTAIQKYFSWADVLIGYRKYAWSPLVVDRNAKPQPIHHDFGRNAE